VGVWGVWGTFDIPQTALVATLDTYDFNCFFCCLLVQQCCLLSSICIGMQGHFDDFISTGEAKTCQSRANWPHLSPDERHKHCPMSL
jgi:hypothetical protein